MQKQVNAQANATVTHAQHAASNNMQTIFAVAQQVATVQAVRAITKKQQVINMCSAASGTTVAAIAAQLLISKVAARSLIGDVRHAKIAVTCTNNVYYIK